MTPDIKGRVFTSAVRQGANRCVNKSLLKEGSSMFAVVEHNTPDVVMVYCRFFAEEKKVISDQDVHRL